eukprot:gene6330-705_t
MTVVTGVFAPAECLAQTFGGGGGGGGGEMGKGGRAALMLFVTAAAVAYPFAFAYGANSSPAGYVAGICVFGALLLALLLCSVAAQAAAALRPGSGADAAADGETTDPYASPPALAACCSALT